MFEKLILAVLLVTIAAQESLACNGYKIRLIKAENCAGPDAVIKIDEGFSLKLNKKCEIVPTGCVTNKAFTKAVSSYKVMKDNILFTEGTVDICSLADHAPGELKDYLKLFGAPASCPVQEEKVCGNNHKVDLSKYKSMLSLARGYTVLDSNIEHDTGKSCFHIEFEIAKN